MGKSHVTGWASDMPTPAQLKEFFAQIENGRITKERLQEFLRGKSAADSVASIFVDYTQPLSEMIKACGCTYNSPGITEKNFPINKRPNAKVEMKVFSTKELVGKTRAVTSQEVIRALSEKGYRPAELPELLAFGVKYPDEQRKRLIIALGSAWQDRDGGWNTPFLWKDSHENAFYRGLYLCWYGDDGQDSFDHFLAVRK